MTDPSFARQLITFTYPHIGNYGVSARRRWSPTASTRARRSCAPPSTPTTRPAPSSGWLDWLRDNGIPGITGVDTRALVRHIRDRGRDARRRLPRRDDARREARERIAAEPSMVGRDLAREVTIAEPRIVRGRGRRPADRRARHRHQALDRPQLHLARRDARAATRARRPPRSCWRATPTAIFLVPGPGDPAALDYIVDTIRELIGQQAGVRHLPRPPAALARRRPGDVQAAVRPPRRQPPGQGPAHRPDRDHVAEPRLRGRAARRATRHRSPTSAPPSSRT